MDNGIAVPVCRAQKRAMTLNLVKLCVGAASVEDLAAWQSSHRASKTVSGELCFFHTTFQTPKRQLELLDGGSLYWVIKGVIMVRQRLVGFDVGHKDDGSPCCVLQLDPVLVRVRPVPRRPFQGWRYLKSDEVPPDLKAGAHDQVASMPAKMRKTLAELGLI